ncbi:hypothetical protein [Streptomyces sp. TRM70350]|uniref:MGH1-like glycoside hydrolase domain-containing protein n=1 Tax=Streptomyces sp. TRM70350 TaxID=2856165 RepID=UPI0027DEC6D0|nr:hypothetical protein [Streptomyces sp. TRM70350]
MDRTARVTDRPAQRSIAYDPGTEAQSPHLRAERVLADNWTGTSTVPSRGLYPHQWSWDSGFIAIGLRHVSPLRAQTELETLLAAQWGDGRIPHIVFNPSVPLDAYFPSPDFWRSSTAGRAAGAPRTVQTSGIVQPPVHALAAWLVHCADPGLSRARGFLAGVYPRLAAWHRYLLHQRDLGGAGLASVVHPWEQGMDNSPCWDAPLARVTPAPARSFRRADLAHGAPEDRPTDLDYGRYVRLATDYRERGYRDGPGGGRGAGVSDFAVEDPAFNALLIASEHALARIARELGATGTARHARAERLTGVLIERLWDAGAGMFFCRDVGGGRGESGVLDGERRPASSAPGVQRGSASSAPDVERRSASSAPDEERRTASSARTAEHRSPQSIARASEHRPESTAHPAEHRPPSSAHATAPGGLRSTAHPTEHRSPAAPLIPERSVSGLVPLLLPTLPRDIAAALVRTLDGPHFGARLVPSYDLLGEAFDPHRYWRGPAWFNTGWLVERGLRVHGACERADALRDAMIDTADASGFAEYVDPHTGEACGATGFSWTAALTLDLLQAKGANGAKGGDRG